MTIIVNFDKNGQLIDETGQPDNSKNLQKNLQDIKSWWQSRNGEIPEITTKEGSLTDSHLTQIDSNLAVTKVDIKGKNVTWSEKGTPKNVDVSGISLDQNGKKLHIYPENSDIEIEFKYE